MAKITYLLGAGASYQCIPVVKGFSEAIREVLVLFQDYQKEKFSEDEDGDNPWNKAVVEGIVDDLTWLLEASSNHASVDTFAKKLFIRKDWEGLQRCKRSLTLIFNVLQSKKEFDKRYDTFFASIIESINQFPEHLNIVSWNYDNQIELAYREYSNENRIVHNQELLKVQLPHKFNKGIKGFQVFKLNGDCGYHIAPRRNSFYYADGLKDSDDKYFEKLLENYSNVIKDNGHPTSLNFAWETEIENNDFLEAIAIAVDPTEVLIIIGYSFPFFNRRIDSFVFSKMKNLKRIYIQDLDTESVKEKILEIRPNFPEIAIKSTNNTYPFLLPREL